MGLKQRCIDCEQLTPELQPDLTIKSVCRFTGQPKWLVDGCSDWSKKIEVYESRDGGPSAIDIKV